MAGRLLGALTMKIHEVRNLPMKQYGGDLQMSISVSGNNDVFRCRSGIEGSNETSFSFNTFHTFGLNGNEDIVHFKLYVNNNELLSSLDLPLIMLNLTGQMREYDLSKGGIIILSFDFSNDNFSRYNLAPPQYTPYSNPSPQPYQPSPSPSPVPPVNYYQPPIQKQTPVAMPQVINFPTTPLQPPQTIVVQQQPQVIYTPPAYIRSSADYGLGALGLGLALGTLNRSACRPSVFGGWGFGVGGWGGNHHLRHGFGGRHARC